MVQVFLRRRISPLQLPHFHRPNLDGEKGNGARVKQPEVVDVLEALREGYAIPSSPHLHNASRAWAIFEVRVDDDHRPARRFFYRVDQ